MTAHVLLETPIFITLLALVWSSDWAAENKQALLRDEVASMVQENDPSTTRPIIASIKASTRLVAKIMHT